MSAGMARHYAVSGDLFVMSITLVRRRGGQGDGSSAAVGPAAVLLTLRPFYSGTAPAQRTPAAEAPAAQVPVAEAQVPPGRPATRALANRESTDWKRAQLAKSCESKGTSTNGALSGRTPISSRRLRRPRSPRRRRQPGRLGLGQAPLSQPRSLPPPGRGRRRRRRRTCR